MNPDVPLTLGVHHVGLTVHRLEDSVRFFTGLLGWQEVGGNPRYPAVFVSDGRVMVTLWAARAPGPAAAFDRERHVGLHHLALAVDSRERLEELHRRVEAAPDVTLEFAPEPLRDTGMVHMMCLEPSGIRIEFIWPGHRT